MSKKLRNDLKKVSNTSKVPEWSKYLMEHKVETPKELREFCEKFPDAKGEVILMKILRGAGIPGC